MVRGYCSVDEVILNTHLSQFFLTSRKYRPGLKLHGCCPDLGLGAPLEVSYTL